MGLKKHITAILLTATLLLGQAMPAVAASRVAVGLEKNYTAICARNLATNENYLEGLPENADYSEGIYILDDLNNKLLANAKDIVYANGIAKDGLYYDENGVQLNTLEYIKNKYYPQFKNATSDTYITFDTETEMRLFMYWYELEVSSSQGLSYSYQKFDNQKGIKILKSEILKFPTNLEEAYQAAVTEDVAKIDRTKSFTDQIIQAATLASDKFTYDRESTSIDVNDALANKKGVCYHYAKYLNGLLKAMGLETKFEIGSLTGSSSGILHSWNTVKDPETGKTYYLDASSIVLTRAMVKEPWFYLANYSQIGVSGL